MPVTPIKRGSNAREDDQVSQSFNVLDGHTNGLGSFRNSGINGQMSRLALLSVSTRSLKIFSDPRGKPGIILALRPSIVSEGPQQQSSLILKLTMSPGLPLP